LPDHPPTDLDGFMERLRLWARALKRDLVAVFRAARDPRTPWIARLVAGVVVAYALSPIDLIPDIIPVLGLLDDLLLVPLGLWLAVRLIPAPILAEHRQAANRDDRLPRSVAAGIVVAALWLGTGALLAAWLFR
jgi:uncharacterized membrane protein YkvA (DUF1232 family)